MHPFLNTSKLTDEEIIAKLLKARQYLGFQMSTGNMPSIQSIQEVIHFLEAERENRMIARQEEERRKVIDKPIELGKIEQDNIT
jgi:hypothetical protein